MQSLSLRPGLLSRFIQKLDPGISAIVLVCFGLCSGCHLEFGFAGQSLHLVGCPFAQASVLGLWDPDRAQSGGRRRHRLRRRKQRRSQQQRRYHCWLTWQTPLSWYPVRNCIQALLLAQQLALIKAKFTLFVPDAAESYPRNPHRGCRCRPATNRSRPPVWRRGTSGAGS